MAKKDNLEIQERFVQLRVLGKSYSQIAEELQVSKRTLISWSNEWELVISNLKRIELEALQERYLLSKEAKFQMFREMLDRVREEFSTRDLKDVGTKELFDVLMRLVSVLEQEAIIFREHENIMEFDLMNGKMKEWEG